jgi:hypothetical protein
MTLEHARAVLAKPPLHLLVACLLGGAFVWPFFAGMSPRHTWFFLHGAWVASVVAVSLFAWGRESSASDDAVHGEVHDGTQGHEGGR